MAWSFPEKVLTACYCTLHSGKTACYSTLHGGKQAAVHTYCLPSLVTGEHKAHWPQPALPCSEPKNENGSKYCKKSWNRSKYTNCNLQCPSTPMTSPPPPNKKGERNMPIDIASYLKTSTLTIHVISKGLGSLIISGISMYSILHRKLQEFLGNFC